MDTPEQFKAVFQQYLENKVTPEEVDELLEYLEAHPDDTVAQDLIEEQVSRPQEGIIADAGLRARLEARLQYILQLAPVIPIRPRTHRFRISRIAAAAIFMVILAAGGYFIFRQNPVKELAKTSAPAKDIAAPAANHAVIQLANGKQIILDSAANGTLATQGNIHINKLNDGQIAYIGSSSSSPSGEAGVGYNTLVNPRGSKVISLTLADGSQVWLNAASSLTYPTVFTGKDRKVSITGEAYFEVTHNAAMPFKVSLPSSGGAGGGEVTVLGTHFNVNAYDDEENIKVTLLEGSVKITKGAVSGLLKPGQQAIIVPSSQLTTKNSVDLEAVMAWKNGRFVFSSTGLASIMREVGRWYNVDVEYRADAANETFTGEVPRTDNVSKVLKMLELTNTVHFSIEGNKIIVTK